LLSKASGQTLSSVRRIRQRAEFEQAFRADRLTNKWFVIYARNNESGCSRLGLVVSKKTMPKAVTRNFAKRLVREVFRRDFPAGLPLDIVVRARRLINPENSAEGRQALVYLLQALRT
jgi:ribonuclease P protein component